jgi:hypothetical protein|tara:strand:+ start:1184 stop:1342 length:159 start_codon:yes stop_codon:yes gene_type:complete
MEEQNQLDKLDQATEKALEQIEKERKNKERDYISEWFRWVELTQKYLKNKLN